MVVQYFTVFKFLEVMVIKLLVAYQSVLTP